jgi:hypothetical protein
MRAIVSRLKKYIIQLYSNNRYFRNISNFFGISFGSGVLYLSVPVTCPCCGNPAGGCGSSFLVAGFAGIIVGLIVGAWNFSKRVVSIILEKLFSKKKYNNKS